MFLKFGAVSDDEASASFDGLEAHCQAWLKRCVEAVGPSADAMHDRAVTLTMQLAYEAGVVAAVWGMHRDTLEAALKVGLAAFDKARALQGIDDGAGHGEP
jgi:hypothetical protein